MAKVLLVDDELTMVQTVSELLRQSGHEVLPFTSGTAALEALATQVPELVITDLYLDKTRAHGLEILQKARSLVPPAIVIVITGFGSIETAVEAMKNAVVGFRGVAHRLEIVGELDGVIYCNDSIATAPERSMASLRSFDEPIVLIAGGRDKHLPMEEWGALIRRRVKALVLLGEATPLIERAVLEAPGPALPPILKAVTMVEAVDLARGAAKPGDVVLLAPGGTSFDQFKDFEERGDCFRHCVRNLAPRRGRSAGDSRATVGVGDYPDT